MTIVDDRKSVLHETESQLNAIEKPFLSVPKPFSRLVSWAEEYFPYLWNLAEQRAEGENEKKLKIPDMSKQ